MGCMDGCQDNAEPDAAHVMRSIQKWRPKCVALNNLTMTFTFNPNQNAPKRLRFNPIVIAEWLQELLDAGKAESQNKLATSLGRSRTQVMQYLRLLTLPPKMLAELRLEPNLREGHLRALTKDVREGKSVTMRKVKAKLTAQGGTRKHQSTGRVVSQA